MRVDFDFSGQERQHHLRALTQILQVIDHIFRRWRPTRKRRPLLPRTRRMRQYGVEQSYYWLAWALSLGVKIVADRASGGAYLYFFMTLGPLGQ